MRHAPVVRIAANTRGRDFAVGDIHGAFEALRGSLQAIGFDPLSDRLFSVGDLVDRGPQSADVLDWLDLPWFHAICGNHDFMTWRSALGRPFESVRHADHGGEWLYDLPPARQQQIGEHLAALPMAIEVSTQSGTAGLIHAELPSDDWNDVHAIDWSGLDRMHSMAGQCLWSAGRYRRRHPAVVDNIRAVVHGHLTLPAMETLGNVYFIDTGGWRRAGRFTFLDLETLRPHLGPLAE